MTIQQIQSAIDNKQDVREIVNMMADYIENNQIGSSYLVAEVILTDAQIKALPTVIIELLPNPPVGKLYNVPVLSGLGMVSVRNNWVADYSNINSGATFFFTNDAVNSTYKPGSSLNPILAPGETTLWFLGPNNHTGGSNNINTPAQWASALYLQIENGGNGNLTGGNAANTLKITVYYTIVDL